MALWIVALVGLVAALYCGADLLQSSTTTSAVFFNGFQKNTWAISLGLVILLCVSGFGGKIRHF